MVSSKLLKSLVRHTERDPGDVHVLAVDDSAMDRRLLEHLLKASSYKVTAVDSVRRALEILGVNEIQKPLEAFSQVNLIITDYCMPGMTGYDLLKKVKGTAALKEIPVVVMSSENEPSRIDSCLAGGAEEFLLKPLCLADVKRLRGHVRHPESISIGPSEASPEKRKGDSEDAVVSDDENQSYAQTMLQSLELNDNPNCLACD
ncbi:hypothetical protein KP509_24G025800 [Ceratopteris richardii]|uniref:Response regulatory domain-containing protein n=1 Tax=Ceratopteris richardii TaxID=49495 RepID=A0A8T2RTD3_CERRI|nr:hypothetical protein KP509_24G025800 [Ceratopteris richardii]